MSDPTALPEVTDSELLLRAPVFDVIRASVRFPDGHEVERVVVRHPGAVALIAVDDAARWLLVRQYRHPAGKELLEIPAGTLEPGEEPHVTAARELREETGFAAASLERIGGAWTAPGFCDEYMHFYLATSLSPDPLRQDEDEGISETVAMTFEELLAAIDDGAIEDGKTLAAVTLWRRHTERTVRRVGSGTSGT